MLDVMPVQLNHTIVAARDAHASASFLAEIMGLPAPARYGPFMVVQTANDVSLDYMDTPDEIASQHYAFLVTEDEFDSIFGRIQAWGLTYWADPAQRRAGEINHNDGGRGVYFPGP